MRVFRPSTKNFSTPRPSRTFNTRHPPCLLLSLLLLLLLLLLLHPSISEERKLMM